MASSVPLSGPYLCRPVLVAWVVREGSVSVVLAFREVTGLKIHMPEHPSPKTTRIRLSGSGAQSSGLF